MKLDYETLEKISAFIDSDGFKAIEKVLEQKKHDNNTLDRIIGDPFKDGESVGIVIGISICRMEIDKIKVAIREMEEDKKGK